MMDRIYFGGVLGLFFARLPAAAATEAAHERPQPSAIRSKSSLLTSLRAFRSHPSRAGVINS